MVTTTSPKRTSRAQYNLFYWGARIVLALASSSLLFFFGFLWTQWSSSQHLQRIQSTHSIICQHVYWHATIQQLVARHYVRDLLPAHHKRALTRGASQWAVGQYAQALMASHSQAPVGYVSSLNDPNQAVSRRILPEPIELPEDMMLQKAYEFSTQYSAKSLLNAIDQWLITLDHLIHDTRWSTLLQTTMASGHQMRASHALVSTPVSMSVQDQLEAWQASYDAVTAWLLSQKISGLTVDSRQLFYLREWVSDASLQDMRALQARLSERKVDQYNDWRRQHLRLLGSLVVSLLSFAALFWLWWYRNDGQRLFDSPHSYFLDRLTGTFNREHFNAIGTKLLKESHEQGYQVFVVTVQIQEFKQLNDVYGFAIGDKILQCLAKRLKENLRATDQLSRVSGGEFAVIASKTDSKSVRLFSDRLKEILSRLSVSGNYGETVKFQTTITFEQCQDNDSVISEPLQRALSVSS